MFQCNRCGECCRNVNKSHLYTNLDRGDGVCKYLDGNICTIYNERPLLCRVDESFNRYFKHTMSKEDYYTLNYQACQMLKEQAKKYRNHNR